MRHLVGRDDLPALAVLGGRRATRTGDLQRNGSPQDCPDDIAPAQNGTRTRGRTKMAGTIDEARLGEFMGQMAGHMTGGALCFAVWLGMSWACIGSWPGPGR